MAFIHVGDDLLSHTFSRSTVGPVGINFRVSGKHGCAALRGIDQPLAQNFVLSTLNFTRAKWVYDLYGIHLPQVLQVFAEEDAAAGALGGADNQSVPE